MAQKKILTVDDSLIIRKVVMKCAKALGCDVVEATNGAECLEMAAKEKPDLIVLDVNMPIMNGDEALVKLRQMPEIKDIPVMMLTTEARKEIVVELIKKGANQYIVKPFTPEVFYQKVNAILSLYEGEFSPEKIAQQGNGKVVLALEDKENILEQIKKALPEGFALKAAGTQDEALSLAKTHAPQFILINLRLNGVDSLSLFNELKSLLPSPKTKYVGMCLRTATDTLREAQEAGLLDLLLKPFSEGEVTEILTPNGEAAEPKLTTEEDIAIVQLQAPKGGSLKKIAGEDSRKMLSLLNEAAEAGYTKISFDFSCLAEADIDTIKAFIVLDRQARNLQVKRIFVNSSAAVKEKLAGLAEAKDLPLIDDLSKAKEALCS